MSASVVTACDLCDAEVDGPPPDDWTTITGNGPVRAFVCPAHHRKDARLVPAIRGGGYASPRVMRRLVALQIAQGAPVDLSELDPIERERMTRLVKMAKRRLRAQAAGA